MSYQWLLLVVLAITGIHAEQLPKMSSLSSGTAFYPQGRDRPHNYEIVKEEVHYSGWRKVIRRSVNSNDDPHRRVVDFDIIDQAHTSGGAVIVFAWNSTSKTATIIREYMPGPHRVLSGLAAGLVEDGKHEVQLGEDKSLVAARCELEEEWYDRFEVCLHALEIGNNRVVIVQEMANTEFMPAI